MIIVILFGIGIFFSLLSQWFYPRITHRDLLRSNKSFYCCRKIFVCIVITFVCLQRMNSLSCRPIDLLYDYRYLSMLILQANGVVLTLSFAFFSELNMPQFKKTNISSNDHIVFLLYVFLQ